MSFQAFSVDFLEDTTPEELLMKCAAVIWLERESVDTVVVQIVCWLPSFLLEWDWSPCVRRRETLMKQAIDVWRWMLAESPLFHVGQTAPLDARATFSARSAVPGRSRASWAAASSVCRTAGATARIAGTRAAFGTRARGAAAVAGATATACSRSWSSACARRATASPPIAR